MYVAQVVKALRYIHQMGMIHRDLKLGKNILLYIGINIFYNHIIYRKYTH